MNLRGAVLLIAVAFSGAAGADGQTLNVILNGIKHDRGNISVALFADKDSFRKADQAFASRQEAAQAGAMSFTFDDLPAGHYGVMAYHDENSNGKLDMRFGMFPAEGYGLSNNPKVMGPPSFEDSEFSISAENPTEISVEFRY